MTKFSIVTEMKAIFLFLTNTKQKFKIHMRTCKNKKKTKILLIIRHLKT